MRYLLCLFFLVSFSPSFGREKKPDYTEILDHAVIISLNRHLHRFEETKQLMEKAGFTNVQRFEGVDGFYTDTKFFEDLNLYQGNPGQKGCTASHLLLLKDFLQSSEKQFLFVAEDDMVPHSNFYELFPLYWSLTPRIFDIVMVGNQMTASPQEPLIVSKPCFCTHAYIISKRGAKKLLNLYKSSSDTREVIDIFLIDSMGKNQLRYYCYNGSSYPDMVNLSKDLIWPARDTGICFQNKSLGTSIKAPEITPYLEKPKN